ncbi:MAG: M23 family metallopeptidase [Oleiphilaceae bacterium]|nr:M23 family metallopeptidase [Oleiphilaceae bacterium]
MQIIISALTLSFILVSQHVVAEIYKYQDANGNWLFTDKKPEAKNAQSINIRKTKKDSPPEVSLSKTITGDKAEFRIENKLLTSVHCEVQLPEEEPNTYLVQAFSNTVILQTDRTHMRTNEIEFWCILGDPHTRPDATATYLVPFKGHRLLEVSQGFNGRFSHAQEPQIHAVDIAMPIATPISAARDGIVISIKNNYSYAGTNSGFFLDKANYVQVLHEDGTYAMYGHLLMGKIDVAVGDKVKAGDLLGRSGNSGFSTGPHLHFVIQYNDQGTVKSVPFRFIQSDGSTVKPKQGMWLKPSR